MTSCGGGAETESAEVESAETESGESTDASDESEMGYVIDPSASTLEFSCEMMGMYTHTGTLNIIEGNAMMENGLLMGGSIVVDMSTIDFTDENFADDSPKENLVGHLMSDAFFDVAKNPTSMLTINQVDNGKTALSTLVIRGTDGSVHIKDIETSDEGGNLVITGTMTFDRQNYGVSWAHPMKEMVIADDVNVSVRVVATKM